jgi:23S rRNA (uracil1939-C5)-methyltransferase
MSDVKKNECHTVTIGGYTAGGDGVAQIDGHVVFVKGALRGETCEIKILKVTKNLSYAKIEKILTASPIG